MGHKVYLTGTNFRPPIPTGTYDPGPAQIGTIFLGPAPSFLDRHRTGTAPAQTYMDRHRTFEAGSRSVPTYFDRYLIGTIIF